MPRFPKPFFRASRKLWYVQLNGKQINLGADRDAAFRRYHELMVSPSETPAAQPAQVSPAYVVGLIQRFMADVRSSRAADTVEWYRWRLQLFIDYLSQRDLEALQASDLRRGYVTEWINSYPRLASGSRRNLCRAIQRVMNWAVENDYLPHSPLARLRKPKAGKRELVITESQWQDILSLAGDDDLRDLLQLTWEIGCRPQESLRVEARHVDLTNQRWVFPVSESKTDAPRIVYLTERALEITRRRMLRFPHGPIFRNSRLRPWTADAVNCGFERIRIRMGQRLMREQETQIDTSSIANVAETLRPTRRVKGRTIRKSKRELLAEARRKLTYRQAKSLAPKFCLYAIRHTWMNRLLTRGIDALTVAILAGHSDPSTLAKVYQHLSHAPTYLQEALRRATA